jgi:hypothetical protein
MRYSWCSIFLVVCAIFTLGPLYCHAGALSKGSQRTITFPKDQVVGAVLIGKYHENLDERGTLDRVCGAIGTVKVTVPDRCYLMFEANRKIFQNPKLLNEISSDGIDLLKLGLISMDDSEDKLCDKALAYVGHFTGLRILLIDRSDASDEALSGLKKLKHLQRLSCFHTNVDGSFLKNLVELPEFSQIDASWCALEPANLKYLSLMPKLDFLNLSRAGIDIRGAHEIAKCLALKSLRIGENRLFNDDCLKALLPLRHLEWIDLRETAVTIAGFRSIRALPLLKLNLPQSMNNPHDLEELKKLFPKAIVLFRSKEVPADIKRTYAPLPR